MPDRSHGSQAAERYRQTQVRALFGKAPPAKLPRSLSEYEIVKPLGVGTRGAIYLARDCRLNRLVAIKTLQPWSCAESKARFLREATCAAFFNHPNIVTVHELVLERDTHWIVMEYIRGKRLDQVISKRGLPLVTCLRYAQQMASALVTIHSNQMVHRDLKPSNFVVKSDGLVKLLDFGLAKSTRSACAALHEQMKIPKTLQGTILGTPGYMSPEQVRGSLADQRSDIFSFGAVLYEMLTGRRAFHEATLIETMRATLRKKPRRLPASIPISFCTILDRCLAKDPEDRYKNARELAPDLHICANV